MLRDLPPGFNNDDFKSIDSLLNEALDDISIANTDSEKFLNRRITVDKQKKSEPIVHTSLIKKVLTPDGKNVDLEKLKIIFLQRPSQILNSNEKLEKSGTASVTLPKFRGLFYDQTDDKFKIVNTCRSAGSCIIGCYAGKGGYVMYEPSSRKASQVLTYLINDYKGWSIQLLKEIKDLEMINNEAGIQTTIRWHDSGDFISPKYLQIVIDIAKKTPNVVHYAYTKEVSMLKGVSLPKNFKITYSFGGKEDNLIDTEKDKYSKIIDPKGKVNDVVIDFKKYFVKRKLSDGKSYLLPKDENAWDNFKNELSIEYNINYDSIIRFSQLPKKIGSKPYWNVIVTPANSDAAAFRDDVKAIFLVKH